MREGLEKEEKHWKLTQFILANSLIFDVALHNPEPLQGFTTVSLCVRKVS